MLTKQEWQLVKSEARKRYAKASRARREHVTVSDYALKCVGEFVVCKAFGIEWRGDILDTAISDCIVKTQDQPFGIGVSKSEPSYAHYFLVGPSPGFPGSYSIFGWEYGEEIKQDKYLTKHGWWRIPAKELRTLEDFYRS